MPEVPVEFFALVQRYPALGALVEDGGVEWSVERSVGDGRDRSDVGSRWSSEGSRGQKEDWGEELEMHFEAMDALLEMGKTRVDGRWEDKFVLKRMCWIRWRQRL